MVWNTTAIATSLNLRCYGVLSARTDGRVAIAAPDLEADYEWDIASLPWDAVPPRADAATAPKELDPVLFAAIEELVAKAKLTQTGTSASIAFLYIYMELAIRQADALAVTLTVSANLPIGAGLGSSAAFSACLAAALLIAHEHVSKYDFPAHEVDLVDAWSFLSEKVLHGNPSGIDNAVAVRGGAVAFTRAVNGKTGGLDGIRGFDSIRLLLTNTRVPRDTKSLVAGVSAKKAAEPHVVDPILEQIQAISDEARALLDGSTRAERDALIARLEALMEENHAHLRMLGVSHPSLEAVVRVTAAAPFGLTTKLTGAGGGGCAVTLIPDTFPDDKLVLLLSELEGIGAEPHLTTLGGPGLGVFRGDTRQAATGLRGAGSKGLEGWSKALEGKWEH